MAFEDFCLTTLSTVIGGSLVAFFAFQVLRIRTTRFEGWLKNSDDIAKFVKFLYDNQEKIFYIDIILNDDNINQLRNDFSFLLIANKEGTVEMGSYQIFFNKKDEEDMFIDYRMSSKRVKGYFKITHSSGPRQGIFSIGLRHVPIELIYNNIPLAGKVSSLLNR